MSALLLRLQEKVDLTGSLSVIALLVAVAAILWAVDVVVQRRMIAKKEVAKE